VLPEDAVSDTLLGSNYVVRLVMIECVKISRMRINRNFHNIFCIFMALSNAQ
jgi:hypothetical protein